MNTNYHRLKTFLFLHLMLMIYSLSGVCSKKAAQAGFLSIEFCLFYGLLIVLLGFYAVCWQQIIKRLPLTTAFSNKAVTIVWGIIWGVIFFREAVSPGKIVGAIAVIVGVVMYSRADGEKVQNE